MEQLNRVELRGNVGNVRVNLAGGSRVANFSLATNYVYKTKERQPAVETTWHNIVAWESKEVPDLTIIRKGAPLYVRGRLRTTRYIGSDGADRIGFEIIANKVSAVEGPAEPQASF